MKKIPQLLFHPHLDPGEEVLDVFHRHPFIMFPSLARITFFTFLVPFFLYYMFPELALFFFIWMGIGIIRLIYVFFNWYHDALLVTNVSLLKTYWSGFFDRSSSRLEYPMIEGISYTIQGFRRTVFNYGHVHVNRSGGSSVLDLPDAINPPKVERVILSHQESFVTDQSMKDSETLKSLLVTMIRQHNKKNEDETSPTPPSPPSHPPKQKIPRPNIPRK